MAAVLTNQRTQRTPLSARDHSPPAVCLCNIQTGETYLSAYTSVPVRVELKQERSCEEGFGCSCGPRVGASWAPPQHHSSIHVWCWRNWSNRVEMCVSTALCGHMIRQCGVEARCKCCVSWVGVSLGMGVTVMLKS